MSDADATRKTFDVTEDAAAGNPLVHLVREYGRDDIHYLLAGNLLQAGKSFVGFADVFVVGLAIDALFNDRAFSLPLLPQSWVPTEPLPLLVFVVGLLFAINASTIVGGTLSDYCSGIYAQRLLHSVRVRAFDAAQRRPLAYFDDARTGDVMSALNDDVNQLETFFDVLVGAAVWIVVTLVAAVVYMAALNWRLAAFVLASAPVVAALNYWFADRLEPLKDDVRAERGALNAHVETNLGGVGVVKAYTAEGYERDRVAGSSLDLFRARFRNERLAATQAPLNRLVVGAWLLGTLALGVYWILAGPPLFFSGTLTAGELVPFLFYLERVTLPLKNLSGVIDGYTGAKAAARRIAGVAAAGDGRQESRGDAADEFTVDDGRVAFEDVTFTYPNADRPALDRASFTAETGETVGLVGATGAGKSTVVKLLLGLYSPDDGTVRVDGHDVAGVDSRELRAAIGYVTQDAFLFNGTVRYNVAYGADGDVSDDRVREAARIAGVHDEIRDLPDGYDTAVGDDGTRLSGGQRQRVAIARAVVAHPEILVLDEATSHVDSETQRVVQERMDDIVADRTTFVVAHRLSTVRAADRILVLDDGKIAERGTHDELLARDGQYADLWNVQVGNAEAVADD